MANVAMVLQQQTTNNINLNTAVADANNVSTTTACDDNHTFVFVNSGNNNNNKKVATSAAKSVAKRPRTSDSSSSGGGQSPPELMRCKRRINFTQLGYALPAAQPTSVARRNERERNRVKLVNLGFATLREHVPNGSKNKKMSKVETLRSAVEYIRKLQELLDDNDGAALELFAESSAGSPLSSSSSTASQNENLVPCGSGGVAGSATAVATAVVTTTAAAAAMIPELCYTIARNAGNAGNLSTSVAVTAVNHHGGGGGNGALSCPPSSVSPASSPTPSCASDCSSPYEPLSPEEEDLLDFTNWFT